MAVKTVWTVEHSCGHEQKHDLGPEGKKKRASERAGYARWLGTTKCWDCYKADKDKDYEKNKAAWVAGKRKEELAEIEVWEQRCDMPALDGSEKQTGWGRRVRHQLLTAAHDHAQDNGGSDDEFGETVETHARKITSAHWWIDQRDSDAEDVAELVEDAAKDPEAQTGTENPY